MLVRRSGAGRRITLVPLIDVLFILLVYFMVTSVYRNLEMVPLVQTFDQGGDRFQTSQSATLLLRITAEGGIAVRGETLASGALAALLDGTSGRVVILPSGAAPLWALTQVLDATRLSGLSDVRLVRLEDAP